MSFHEEDTTDDFPIMEVIAEMAGDVVVAEAAKDTISEAYAWCRLPSAPCRGLAGREEIMSSNAPTSAPLVPPILVALPPPLLLAWHEQRTLPVRYSVMDEGSCCGSFFRRGGEVEEATSKEDANSSARDRISGGTALMIVDVGC